jgi:PTS system fructose-specific IIC component
MSIADKPGFMPSMIGGFMAMTSGAGFLGGMLAGFVGGYSSNFIKKITSTFPKNLDGIKVILIYPVLGLLLTGFLMKLLLVPVSSLNVVIINLLENLSGTNLVLLGVILGGMMAVDMGGPINKAAFTFGLAAIAAGDLHPHAAVMAGGMVPPLGIALATTFFKHLFSKEDREAGITNYVLGASFITEGAIPFAAKDPTVIIPSCIIGSAVAGGLTMYFNCTLPAPHGGIFVIPLVNNPILYLISILLGAITTALFIVIFKKKTKTIL